MPWQVHCDIIALEMHCRCPICQFNAIYEVIIGLHRGTWLWQVVKNFHFCFQLQSYVLNDVKCKLINVMNIYSVHSRNGKRRIRHIQQLWIRLKISLIVLIFFSACSKFFERAEILEVVNKWTMIKVWAISYRKKNHCTTYTALCCTSASLQICECGINRRPYVMTSNIYEKWIKKCYQVISVLFSKLREESAFR